MRVKVLGEAGFKEALLGLSLSYNSYPSKRVADRLAHRGGGHSKFLESMQVWLDIDAKRGWWAEADTYRLSTKQSESTMHTLTKRLLTTDDFVDGVDCRIIDIINEKISSKDLKGAKDNLPEGFLQRRVWCLNYKTLQNIAHQRSKHRMKDWEVFLNELRSQLQHPEYVFQDMR